MEAISIASFLKDREEALLSLDRETLVRFIRKWQVKMPIPQDGDERLLEMFWVVVHKARVALPGFDAHQRALSAAWLRKHGSGPRPGSPPAGEVTEEQYAAWEATLERK